MKAENADVKMWQLAKRHGDITQLSLLLKVSRPKLMIVLAGGEAEPKLINGINKFYRDREARERKTTSKLTHSIS